MPKSHQSESSSSGLRLHGHGRSRSRRKSNRKRAEHGDTGKLYQIELLVDDGQRPLPTFELPVDEDGAQRLVPHVCAPMGKSYVVRVRNDSRRHIACAVAVDGENALLRRSSLIVAPGDTRRLPGFLVSKNFVGREYIKEYRNFVFSKPRVVESNASDEAQHFGTYGCVTCEVFNAELEEEVDSDQELTGQTSFYRGAGLNGSFDERIIPEGKKSHLLFSSVTFQGSRSSIANSTRGRWWVRGKHRLCQLEVRYREAHSLMLLGLHPKELGFAHCKEEHTSSLNSQVKLEDLKDEKEEKTEICMENTATAITNATESPCPVIDAKSISICDLTRCEDNADEMWTTVLRQQHGVAVSIDS